jgi:hypothetical protein
MPMEPTTEESATKMVPASTEILELASAKVDAAAAKEERSRAYILRRAIHAWADTQPTPRGNKASRPAPAKA